MKRYLAAGLFPLALAGCDAMTAHTDTVARAGQHELTVEETVELLTGNPRIPANTEVVGSIAELWVDYTVLAELVSGDSLLGDLDLQPLLQQYIEQRTFQQLREQVVTTDTVISDEELRELYAEQAPGARVRARHILLSYPEGATQAQRDSVRQLAEQLRERAVGGEDFAELARQYSEDPGSARTGGDLGWFERGRMVKPFEDAAFALQPGEVSEPVESPFGIHVIRVEERETPAFGEVGPEFRTRMVQQRRAESLEQYVQGLVGPAGLEIEASALDVARNLAREPSEELGGRAAEREMVTWQGGALTAAEFLEFVRRLPPQQRAQFASAPDEQLEAVLQDVATNELVIADAAERGVEVAATETDSIAGVIRQQIVQAAQQAGLAGEAQQGEAEGDAVERRVRSYLDGILNNRQQVIPLGALTYVLRQEVDWNISEQTFPEVVEELEERRAAQDTVLSPMSPLPGGPAGPSLQAPAGAGLDTASGAGAAPPQPDTGG